METNPMLISLLSDILGKPKKFNKTNGQYAYDCPVCSAEKGMDDGDGKGNLEVNINKKIYHCWACGDTHGTHGSLWKLVKLFGSKVHHLKIKKYGINLGSKKEHTKVEQVVEILQLPSEYVKFSEANENSLQYKQAKSYLKNRGITDDIIEKYEIGYATEGDYANRIILPSFDTNGELNYFVTRTYTNQKPKYKNPHVPKESLIFNEKLINWDSTIYIVEGPFDHIVVHNSIPLLGKHMYPLIFEKLFNKASSNVVLLLDSDAWNDAVHIYSMLNVGKLRDRVKIIKLPDGLDISDINKHLGKDGVIKVLFNTVKLKESRL